MLLDTLKADLNNAVKSKDSVRVETLRFLLAAIINLEIDKYPPSLRSGGANPPSAPMTDEDVLSVVRKQVKTHNESIEMFKKGKREDLVDRETAQLQILQGYLPKQLSLEEIAAEIHKIKKQLRDEGKQVNFGMLMAEVMKTLKGKADGKMVAQKVKEELGLV